MGQVLIQICKVGGAWLQISRICRPGEIPHGQLLVRKQLLQRRLQMAKILQPFQQGIPDQDNAIALRKV